MLIIPYPLCASFQVFKSNKPTLDLYKASLIWIIEYFKRIICKRDVSDTDWHTSQDIKGGFALKKCWNVGLFDDLLPILCK